MFDSFLVRILFKDEHFLRIFNLQVLKNRIYVFFRVLWEESQVLSSFVSEQTLSVKDDFKSGTLLSVLPQLLDRFYGDSLGQSMLPGSHLISLISFFII